MIIQRIAGKYWQITQRTQKKAPETISTTSTVSGHCFRPNIPVQRRFKHLFTKEGGEKDIKKIQAIADKNIVDFRL